MFSDVATSKMKSLGKNLAHTTTLTDSGTLPTPYISTAKEQIIISQPFMFHLTRNTSRNGTLLKKVLVGCFTPTHSQERVTDQHACSVANYWCRQKAGIGRRPSKTLIS